MNIIVNEEALVRLLDTMTELPRESIQSAINECKLKINSDTRKIIDETLVSMNSDDETLLLKATDLSLEDNTLYINRISHRIGKPVSDYQDEYYYRSLTDIIDHYLDVDLNKHQR